MALLGKLGNYRNFGLLVIRVGLGLMFIYHGLPKLQRGVNAWHSIGLSMQTIGITFLPAMWGFYPPLPKQLAAF